MNLYLIDGARLKSLRERSSLSQEDLSEALGRYNPNGVRLVEELEAQDRVHVLELVGHRIAKALEVEISMLSSYPEPPEETSPPVPQAPDVPVAGLAPNQLSVDVAKLKALREEASLSSEVLEEQAGLKHGWVTKAESTDQSEEFRARGSTLRKLAGTLGVEMSELVSIEEQNSRSV
jgi:transcriptional regulator with XRE-family HTH domain